MFFLFVLYGRSSASPSWHCAGELVGRVIEKVLHAFPHGFFFMSARWPAGRLFSEPLVLGAAASPRDVLFLFSEPRLGGQERPGAAWARSSFRSGHGHGTFFLEKEFLAPNSFF